MFSSCNWDGFKRFLGIEEIRNNYTILLLNNKANYTGDNYALLGNYANESQGSEQSDALKYIFAIISIILLIAGGGKILYHYFFQQESDDKDGDSQSPQYEKSCNDTNNNNTTINTQLLI
ncbi:MAG: hypothetical protein RCG15_04215 [Candidatus Rickettsia vulgarisii]